MNLSNQLKQLVGFRFETCWSPAKASASTNNSSTRHTACSRLHRKCFENILVRDKMKQPVLRIFSRDAPKTFPGHDVPRPSGGPLLVANLRRPWSRPTSPSIPSPSKFGCRRTVPSVLLGSSETLLSHSSCLPAYSKGREHHVFSSRVYSKDTEVLLTMTFDTTFIKAVVHDCFCL